MESLNVPVIDISLVRRYSSGQIADVDFSSSDDFAAVVERLKNLITLPEDVAAFWSDDHDQALWQFVIDPDTPVFCCSIQPDGRWVTQCSLPDAQTRDLFYFVKVSPESLTTSDLSKKLIWGTAQWPVLESLYEMLSTVYAPMFQNKQNSVQSEFEHHLTTLLSELNDVRSDLRQQLVFFVPENISTVDSIDGRKELVKQVESCVLKWISTLRRVMDERDSNHPGLLEEMAFWEKKSSDYDVLLSQLRRPDVLQCCQVLKAAQLTSFFRLEELATRLKKEHAMVRNNVKVLSLLQEPYEDISAAKSLCDILQKLPKLLDIVRIIWTVSPFYRKKENISKLLHKVNSFVIHSFSKFIPLEEVFDSKDLTQKPFIADVINACQKWMAIFEVSEKAHECCATETWSVEPPFPLVEIFIHRFQQLIQICDLKQEFECSIDSDDFSRGSRCFEIMDRLKNAEVHFGRLLRNLGQNRESCLDMKSGQWFEHLKKFQDQVQELEYSISQLMLKSFENLNTIEECLRMLALFQKHRHRKVVKRCVSSVFGIFSLEMEWAEKQMQDLEWNRSHFKPLYGEVAFKASILPRRIKHLYKVLKEANHLWPREFDLDVEDRYQQVLDATAEFIRMLNVQWAQSLPKEPFNWLKDPVIIKENSSGFIQVNLSSDVLNLIEELFYWDKNGVELPHVIIQLHEKSDAFVKRIMKCVECVHNYNRLVQCLLCEEMFSDVRTSLSEYLKPVLLNVTWSSPSAALHASLNTLTEQLTVNGEVYAQYQICLRKLESHCQEIGKKSLFRTDMDEPMEWTPFLQMQTEYKDSILEEVSNLFKLIIHLAAQISQLVTCKRSEPNSISPLFSDHLMKLMCSALVSCYANSLASLASLFGANRSNTTRLVLHISLTVTNNQIYYVPHFKELCTGVIDLLEMAKDDLSKFMKIEEENIDQQISFLECVNQSVSRQDLETGLSLLSEAQKRHLSEWRQCTTLGEAERSHLLKKYEDRDWSLQQFQNDVSRFLSVGGEIEQTQRYKTLLFCLVDCKKLKEWSAKGQEEWKQVLRAVTHANMQDAYDLFQQVAANYYM